MTKSFVTTCNQLVISLLMEMVILNRQTRFEITVLAFCLHLKFRQQFFAHPCRSLETLQLV